jgi:hypothetical protein
MTSPPAATSAGPPGPQPAFAPAEIAYRGVTGRVMGTAAAVDPIAKLPAAPRKKLEALRQAQEDVRVVLRDLGERRRQANERRQAAVASLETARTSAQFRRIPGSREAVTRAETEHKAGVVECNALDERISRLEARLSPLPKAIDAWLERLPRGAVIELHDASVDVKLGKNESATVAIERSRERLAELAADLHQVRSAPLPSADVKNAVRAQVEDLAAKGCPGVMGALEIGSPLTWPRSILSLQVQGTSPGGAITGLAMGEAPDAFALTVWANKEAILEKLFAEIDALADDDASLDDLARSRREKEIAAEALAVERHEEALIELAEGQGTEIARRPDADPRAVLHLSAALAGVSR